MSDKKKDMKFAARVVRLRLDLPLRNATPVEKKIVAKEVGVSLGSYSLVENGVIPGEKVLIRIARYYKVSEDYLLGKENAGGPAKKQPAPLYNKGVSPQARDNDGLYGKTEHVESNGVKLAVTTHSPRGHSHQMAPIKAVEALTTILQSGNSTIVRAILSNLEAFGSAVEQETRDKARIAALEEKCNNLISRMSDMEEKMTLILEAQEQKKTASTNA